jgi:hypothetical protein
MFLLVKRLTKPSPLQEQMRLTGWQLTSSPQGTGTAGGTAATRLSVFYRWVTGTEAAPGVGDSGDHQIARIIAYSGVHPTTPFNVQTGNVKTTASTAVTFPSVTTTVADCMILLMEAHALPDSTSTAIISGQTNANLSAITERMDNNTNAGNGGGFSLTEGIKATAGATGTTSATLTTSATQGWITLALQPAPVAQSLTQNTRFDNGQTFYNPTVTVGAVSLTVPLYTNTQVFYTHEVTASGGPQSLTVPLYTNNNTFYAHSVTSSYSVTATRYDNANAFYAPSVAAVYTLTAARFDNVNTFYSATVANSGNVLFPPYYVNNNTFYNATLAANNALTVNRYDNSNAFYNINVVQNITFLDWVEPGHVEDGWVSWPYFNAPTFFEATLTPGAVSITVPLLSNTNVFYDVAVDGGEALLFPELVTNNNVFYTAAVVNQYPDPRYVLKGYCVWPRIGW